MNEPKSQLEQYDSLIKEIFTPDKLPAIFAVINHLRPPYGEWVKEDQFKTVVNAATNQAYDDLQKNITQYVINNSIIKPTK